eukprot:1195871-Prorocentrum_minimum.AAC.14
MVGVGPNGRDSKLARVSMAHAMYDHTVVLHASDFRRAMVRNRFVVLTQDAPQTGELARECHLRHPRGREGESDRLPHAREWDPLVRHQGRAPL